MNRSYTDTETCRYQLILALWTAFTGWTVKSFQCLSSWINLKKRKDMVYLEEDGKDLKIFSRQLSSSTNNWNSNQTMNTGKEIVKTLIQLSFIMKSVKVWNWLELYIYYNYLYTIPHWQVLIAVHVNVEEETPAQAEARANASNQIKMESVSKLWNWAKETFKMG